MERMLHESNSTIYISRWFQIRVSINTDGFRAEKFPHIGRSLFKLFSNLFL